ncbi:MAG: rhomboid family intramembrane serine protease [Pseudomonadota bacterium]
MFFLPIRDHNPSGRVPYVTYVLIAANVLIFVVMLALDQRATGALYWTFGLVPAYAAVDTAVTSMFLHGGFLHLAGNMLFLWIYGDNMEDEMGHGWFAMFYLACGVAAGFAHVASAPGSDVPLIGASGAIGGVMGAYLLLYPKARVDVLFVLLVFFRIFPIPAWIVLAFWFATQILSGAATPADGPGVAYWAHVGGFVTGIAMAIPVFLRRGGPSYWQRTHGHPPHPEAVYRRSSIPAVRRKR